MIETITKNNLIFATIIRHDYKSTGIKFFTPEKSPQQLGYMNREKGYMIKPHRHECVEKTITHSFETLVVKSGKIKVAIYDENDDYFTETIITTGDVIMIGDCGHGFEMLEDSEMIEIKQGPYVSGLDTRPLNTYSTPSFNKK